MGCSSYAGPSSSDVSLWYAAEQTVTGSPEGAPGQLVDGSAIVWLPIPFTAESLTASHSATPVSLLGAKHVFTRVTRSDGSVSGSISGEVQANAFLYDMLTCVLRSSKTPSFSGSPTWTSTIHNESSPHRFAVLKRVAVETGYDWHVFRGVRAVALTIDVSSDALVPFTVELVGERPDQVIESAASISGWTFATPAKPPLMSGRDSLRDLVVSAWDGAQWQEADAIFQSLTIRVSNEYEEKRFINGTDNYTNAVVFGAFSATYSGSVYYADASLYDAFLEGTKLRLSGSLLDSDGAGFLFSSGYVEAVSGAAPQASGGEQDLIAAMEFHAIEDANTCSVVLTKQT